MEAFRRHMVWTDSIVILAATRMKSGVCVAGLDSQMNWVRPIGYRQFKLDPINLTCQGKYVVENYNRVELQFDRKTGQPPHSEDVVVDWSRPPRLLETLDDDDVFDILHDSDETSRVGNNIETYLHSHGRSIVNIHPEGSIDCLKKIWPFGKVQRKLVFTVNEVKYTMSCTDLRWRALTREDEEMPRRVLRNSEETVLTIGLTRPWGKWPGNERIWPLVLTVHTYPRYEVVVDYDRL